MAEYIVSLIIEKLASQLVEEAGSLSGVHDQVEWIEDELKRMQCFLKSADAIKDSDERVRNWVADIREVAYDTEDVIDTYICCKFKRYPFVFFHELIARYKVNQQISRIKTKIHDITTSRSTYGIANINSGVDHRLREKRRSFPHVWDDDDFIVGLDEDIRILGDQVIHDGGSRRSVISIIGMAGSGKTTLAKKIYQSSDVRKEFDCCAWVYVSQDYTAGEVLQDLCKKIMGVGKAELDKMHKDDIQDELSNFLQRKRYIIVLDDIWKKLVWDDLKSAFPDAKNGSRIILTTRFKDIALHADPRSSPYEVCLLKEEDGWELLSNKAFPEPNAMTRPPPWCEDLGKQVVKKCGGLPLAIVVLGGLLSTKEATYSEWLKVLQTVQWQLSQDPANCAHILNLSYQELPYYLKPCFLYVGLFPEDFEISARRLILLWIAEGFVLQRGTEMLEDVAEDYLDELIGRSMIQAATRKSNGRIKTIRVHDLLRELSISKAKEDRFLDIIHGDVNAYFLARARRLAIHFGIPPTTRNTSRIRSLLFFDLSEPVWRKIKKFKLLQVLDLEGIHIDLLSSCVGTLIRLRYLGLRNTWLKKLPSSVGNLSNLQTLDLSSTLIDPIPAVIWKMKQLRHLYFNELREMIVNPPAPAEVCLPDLQTLQGICICNTSCIDQGLSKLTSLRDLGLHGTLIFLEEDLGKWISNLKDLRCLKLHTVSGDYITTGIVPKFTFSNNVHLYKLHLKGFKRNVFDVQDFPPNLTELSLQYSFLMEDPMEKLEKLPNLRVLKLKQSSYVGKEMVCSNGGFPQLHFLKLSNLNSVRKWTIEEGAMCNLRELEIVKCKGLKIVPRGLQPVTTLRKLKLGYMPFESEMVVHDRRGENWYRLEHVLPI